MAIFYDPSCLQDSGFEIGPLSIGRTVDPSCIPDAFSYYVNQDVSLEVVWLNVQQTRHKKLSGAYVHEFTEPEHSQLADQLHQSSSMIVLSGYRCDLLNSLYADWQRVDYSATDDGGKARVESLWLNAACLAQQQLALPLVFPKP